MEKFKVIPHWSLRGVTPVRGKEVEVYYHGTLREYHDKVVETFGKYQPTDTSTSAYINLTKSWPKAMSWSRIRKDEHGNQNTPTLLIISPEKAKRVLVPNTGSRPYAFFLDKDMYKPLDIELIETPEGEIRTAPGWTTKLENIIIDLLGLKF